MQRVRVVGEEFLFFEQFALCVRETETGFGISGWAAESVDGGPESLVSVC